MYWNAILDHARTVAAEAAFSAPANPHKKKLPEHVARHITTLLDAPLLASVAAERAQTFCVCGYINCISSIPPSRQLTAIRSAAAVAVLNEKLGLMHLNNEPEENPDAGSEEDELDEVFHRQSRHDAAPATTAPTLSTMSSAPSVEKLREAFPPGHFCTDQCCELARTDALVECSRTHSAQDDEKIKCALAALFPMFDIASLRKGALADELKVKEKEGKATRVVSFQHPSDETATHLGATEDTVRKNLVQCLHDVIIGNTGQTGATSEDKSQSNNLFQNQHYVEDSDEEDDDNNDAEEDDDDDEKKKPVAATTTAGLAGMRPWRSASRQALSLIWAIVIPSISEQLRAQFVLKEKQRDNKDLFQKEVSFDRKQPYSLAKWGHLIAREAQRKYAKSAEEIASKSQRKHEDPTLTNTSIIQEEKVEEKSDANKGKKKRPAPAVGKPGAAIPLDPKYAMMGDTGRRMTAFLANVTQASEHVDLLLSTVAPMWTHRAISVFMNEFWHFALPLSMRGDGGVLLTEAMSKCDPSTPAAYILVNLAVLAVAAAVDSTVATVIRTAEGENAPESLVEVLEAMHCTADEFSELIEAWFE